MATKQQQINPKTNTTATIIPEEFDLFF